MSQDIRRFLQVKTSPAPVKKRRIEDDDDDVIPESPDVQIKTKKKKTTESKLSSKNKSPKPALKEVKVTDLFGNGQIKRTEPVVKKAEPKTIKNTETGIHSDDEFEKSLLEIDGLDDVVYNKDKPMQLPEVSTSKGESHKKQKHSLSIPKHKSEHNNEKKTSTKSKSPVKDGKQKHLEIKNNVDAKKKEIRDTNKRKFDVFLESDDNTDDINKKTKIDDSLKSKTKSDDSHKSRSTSDDSHKIKNQTDDHHHSLNKSGDSHKSKNNSDDFQKSKSKPEDSHKSKGKSDDSHKNKNKSDDCHKSKSTTDDSLKSKGKSNEPLKSKSKSDDSFKNKSKSDVSLKSKSTSDDSHKTKINGVAEKSKTNGNVSAKTESYDLTADDSMMSEADQSVHKKRNKSLNESVLTDEERHERKIHSAQLYQKYLNRTGPKHLGTKDMPEGAPNCLKDYAFLLTGVLDSFDREEIEETIKKYGGSIKSGISKKVTHVLAGEDAGPAKMAKAADLGIRIINEDEFLKILVDSKKKNAKSEAHRDKKDKKSDHEKKSDCDRNSHTNKLNFEKSVKDEVKKLEIKKEFDEKKSVVKKEKSDDHENVKLKLEVNENHDENNIAKISDVVKLEGLKSESEASTSSFKQSCENVKTEYSGMMWVEKHKPQTLKQIIGQHGDASNVNKLTNWLKKWYVNRKAKLAKPSPWAKNDDGGFYKAALLSGPPGVGKTTSVALVCKELGFDTVEFNASDTRNKTLIKEQIGELLTTTSLSAYAKGDTGKQAVTKKHVLVMDEVDGMAGNEDRGGLQELIGLIKTTSVPIICMCNDRNSQKMRSLVNYCYDLRFSRPRVDQIKAAMRSICCKENIKIPPDVLGQLIVSANQDVRQTLNLLSMWAVDPSLMDADKLSKDASVPKKDVKLGPWEAIRKVFSSEDHKKMSINDKSDLFFYDYSLSPLFVQENYLQVQPHCPKDEVLDRISKAAESIAIGDTIEKRIRSAQAWNLLPMQAMYSSVIPGHHMSGHVTGQIQFPGWLGKNSRANKMHRLCQEIHAHTRLSTTGSKSSIFLDYAPHLRDAIIAPLISDKSEGIERSLQVLESYHLLREDLESLSELAQWPGAKNPAVLVDSKVKAAMTRTYNKKASALPYAPGAIKRGKAKDDDDDENDDDNDDDAADSDPENDALIKKKKSKESEKPHSNDKPSTSKGSKSSAGKGKKKK